MTPGPAVRDVLVLCYHAVSAGWPSATAVTPAALAAHVAHLQAAGYTGATFSDAVLAPPAARTVAFTFDDAHRSVLEHAHPILSAAGWPATVFVATDYAAGDRILDWPGLKPWFGGPWHSELAPLTWAELERLAADGWEIGSHTCSHARLTTLSDAALASELHDSRAGVEQRLQRSCEAFAYPYGDHDARVVRAVRAAGYRVAATAPRTRVAPLPLMWTRPVVARHDTGLRFRIRTSPTLRQLGALPRVGPAIDRLRPLARTVLELSAR